MQKSNYIFNGLFHLIPRILPFALMLKLFRSTTLNQNMLFVCFVRLFCQTSLFSKQSNRTESDNAQGPHSATHGYGRRFPVSPATGETRQLPTTMPWSFQRFGLWVHFGVVRNLKSSFFYFLIQFSLGKSIKIIPK